ncbi:MAG: hypothetical protein DMF72_07060 [Acidobacteria bacterium]|nr:MAG: hypothetical protein DMF72_07060 [Acidobacteriota bacterium]
MKFIIALFLVFTTVFLTGCPYTPKKPDKMGVLISYEAKKLEGFEDDYFTAYDNNDLETARRRRNRIVEELRNLIDSNYFDFEIQLSRRRATENILFDSLETGTAIATGIAKGVRVKDILAIALTGSKSFHRSFDENIFKDKSIEAIISKMREARAEIGTVIDDRMSVSVETYSLKKAYNDLLKYFYAGTLQNGLQNLVQDAGKSAAKAEETASDAEEIRVASESEFDNSKRIRQKITQLAKDLKSDDQQKQAMARDEVNKALTNLGVTLPSTATDTDRIRALVQKSAAATKSQNRQQEQTKLMQALGIQ